MSWKDKYSDYVRPKRPKARKCTKADCDMLLEKFLKAVRQSPVLMALGYTINVTRSRFYVCQPGTRGLVQLARITPLDESDDFILECPGRGENWFEITKGQPEKLVNAIANDTRGTFHGLGSIDKLLRTLDNGGAKRADLVRCTGTQSLPEFKYASGELCPAQIALHCCFGIPIDVLIEPREWYIRHRTPCIIEYSMDLTRVLVQFRADTLTSTIIGTCLYLKHPPNLAGKPDSPSESGWWGAYTIRPNESDSIASAEAWIVKRKWDAW